MPMKNLQELIFKILNASNRHATPVLNSTTLHQDVFIKLQAGGSPCSNVIHTVLAVNLNQTCPPGFNISKSNKSCVCEQGLAKYTNNCTISNGVSQIARNSNQQFWVCYDQSDELILHPHCPFDYCVNDTVVFPLNNTDKQRANNRSPHDDRAPLMDWIAERRREKARLQRSQHSVLL